MRLLYANTNKAVLCRVRREPGFPPHPSPFVFGFGRARLPARSFQEATAEQQRAADRAGVHPQQGTARRAQTGQRSTAGRDLLSLSARRLRAAPPACPPHCGRFESSLGFFFIIDIIIIIISISRSALFFFAALHGVDSSSLSADPSTPSKEARKEPYFF